MKTPPQRQWNIIFGLVTLFTAISTSAAEEKKIPDPAPQPEIMVECEWLLLPHMDANRLIRTQMAGGADGGRTRKAALELISQGHGRHWHRQAGRTSVGSVKIQQLRKQEYPWSWLGVAMSPEVIMQGGKVVQGSWLPARPSSFRSHETGYTFSAEVRIGTGSHQHIYMNMVTGWSGHVDNHTWGEGAASVTAPVMYRIQAGYYGDIRPRQWTLTALLTPPSAPLGSQENPGPENRLMLFTRASISGGEAHVPERPLDAPGQLLTEWITVPQEPAMELIGRFPAPSDAPALRLELQKLMDRGQASLTETSFMISGESPNQNSTQSAYEFLVPSGRWNGDERPGKIIEYPASPSAGTEGKPPFWPAGPSPSLFDQHILGLAVQAEMSSGDYSQSIQVSCSATLNRPSGIIQTPDHSGFREDLRTAFLETKVHRALPLPGQPLLMAFQDAPAPASIAKSKTPLPPAYSTDKIFVFLTAQRMAP